MSEYKELSHENISENECKEKLLSLPVLNRSMLGAAASGLGAAATSGADSNKSKTKNTHAFTQLDKPARNSTFSSSDGHLGGL